MPPPDRSTITVATDALRRDADVWHTTASELGELARSADGLRLNRIQAGMFQLVVDAYAGVIDQVTARAREGAHRMTAIHDTLRASADTYDREEARNVHALRNLY